MSGPRRALVGLVGPRLSQSERVSLRRLRPAGVLLFARNVHAIAQVQDLIADVRATLASVGVEQAVVAVDQEGGAVVPFQRVFDADPSAASLGWVGRTEFTRWVHAERARALRDCGVDLVLAPVADVDRPGNPVIATRAFGTDPDTVSMHVRAAIEGLHAGGVRACAKHWPGHGSPRLDSHLDAAILEIGEATRMAIDAPPFAAAASAGVDAMMLAHLIVPAWSAAPALPVGVDPAAVQRLREETGFTGPLLSDAVEMKGLMGRSPYELIAAGIDLVLFARPVDSIEDACAAIPCGDPVWTEAPQEASLLQRRSIDRDGSAAIRTWGSPGILRGISRVWVLDAASNDRLLRLPNDEAAPLEGGQPGEMDLVDLWRDYFTSPEIRQLRLAELDPGQPAPWSPADALVVLAVRPLGGAWEQWIAAGPSPRVLMRFGAAALQGVRPRAGGAPSGSAFVLFSPEIRIASFRRLRGEG